MAYSYKNKINREWISDVEPPNLHARHLSNSRILPNREAILEHLVKGGICAEVGTYKGHFAKKIIESIAPQRLHIIDKEMHNLERKYFEEPIASGQVELHEGDSSAILKTFPNNYFDLIYIDGDHTYKGVKKDLEQARLKAKLDGWIVCNDYTIYSCLNETRFGIPKAVHEMCLSHDWEIVYLGLNALGFHDVALRKIRDIL